MRRLLSWIFLACCSVVQATTYYVSKSGNDGYDGSQAHPWITIAYSAGQIVAGDVVRVQPGTYDERVTITTSGNSGAWISFVADGQVIMRGFTINGASYIKIVGFEITHNSTTYSCGILMQNSCSNIQVLDNYIHEVKSGAVIATTGSTTSYITVRGNNCYYLGCVSGVYTNADEGIANNLATSDHWLVEYNSIQRAGDFIDCHGTNVIVRNNYLHDYSNVEYNATDAWHSDMFQPGSGGVQSGSRHHIYERNFCGDSMEANSHFLLWRDTDSYGDTNVLVRGNVAYNIGDGGIGCSGVDKVSTYNNSFYKVAATVPSATIIFYNEGSDYSLNNLLANTIVYDKGANSYSIKVIAGSTAIFENNLGYLAGADASFVSTSDPMFIDPSTHNFRLQPGSPAIGIGTNVLWVTSANGSGTTFDVSDGQLLTDGWNVVDGDTITVGSTTTSIVAISVNSVTVADSVTWTNNMPIYWGPSATTDVGAFPYGSVKLTAATMVRSGSIYTVMSVGDCRGVWFYVDGLPAIWDASPPYSATIANGVVTAKAYALYAQDNPVVAAGAEGAKIANFRCGSIKGK